MTIKQMLPGLLLWLAIILGCLGLFLAMANQVLCYLGVILLAVHLLEVVFFQKKIQAQGDSKLMGFIYTMLFGFVYWNRKN